MRKGGREEGRKREARSLVVHVSRHAWVSFDLESMLIFFMAAILTFRQWRMEVNNGWWTILYNQLVCGTNKDRQGDRYDQFGKQVVQECTVTQLLAECQMEENGRGKRSSLQSPAKH